MPERDIESLGGHGGGGLAAAEILENSSVPDTMGRGGGRGLWVGGWVDGWSDFQVLQKRATTLSLFFKIEIWASGYHRSIRPEKLGCFMFGKITTLSNT